MQGNVRLPLSNPPHGIGSAQLEYLSQEDALLHWKGEESSGKVSIGGHGNEKARIVVSESSEGRQHSENFMGCTVIWDVLMFSKHSGSYTHRFLKLC